MAIPFGGGDGGGSSPAYLSVSPSSPYSFGSVAVGNTAPLAITVSNDGDISCSITAITVGGAPYTLSGGPALPKHLNSGESFTITLNFSPTSAATFNDTFTVTATAGTDNSPFSAAISGTGTVATSVAVTPISPIDFGDIVVTKSSGLTTITITNNGPGAATINTIALATGTQFTLSALPVLPITLNNPGDNTTFKCKFNPTGFGAKTDTINIDTTVNDPAIVVQGNGVQVTPVASLNLGTRKILFSFSDNTPVILHKTLDPSNSSGLLTSNGVLAGTLIFNSTLWDNPGFEKKLRRVEIYYENVGVCTLTATAQVWRPSIGADSFDSKPSTITLGTAGADLTERSGFFDLQIAGEIIKLTITRNASAGPCSIIGLIPHFEDAGEKIAGQ